MMKIIVIMIINSYPLLRKKRNQSRAVDLAASDTIKNIAYPGMFSDMKCALYIGRRCALMLVNMFCCIVVLLQTSFSLKFIPVSYFGFVLHPFLFRQQCLQLLKSNTPVGISFRIILVATERFSSFVFPRLYHSVPKAL